MSPYELLDVAFMVATRVDVQWSIYITVHLTIFGGLIYMDRPLRFTEKCTGLLTYFGFAILSFRILRTQLLILEQAYLEIAKYTQNVCCSENGIILQISTLVADGRFKSNFIFLNYSHIIMALLVVLAIFFAHAHNNNSSSK